VVRVAEFDVEVGLPTAVERGVRQAGGLELIGKRNPSASKGEGIMRRGYGVSGHDGDEKDGDGRQPWLDALLVIADETWQCGHQKAKRVAIVDYVGSTGIRKEKQAVCGGEGSDQ